MMRLEELRSLCTAAAMADGEPDCDTCQNTGDVWLRAATVDMPVPCPECPRGDWHAEAAELDSQDDR